MNTDLKYVSTTHILPKAIPGMHFKFEKIGQEDEDLVLILDPEDKGNKIIPQGGVSLFAIKTGRETAEWVVESS